MQAGDYFSDGFGNGSALVFRELDVLEEVQRLLARHGEDVVDVLAGNLHVEGFFAEAAAVTFIAVGASAEAVLHELVLYLVSLGVHPFKEFVDADDALFIPVYAVAVPDNLLFGFAEVAVGLEGADAVPGCDVDQVLGEPAHLVSTPAGDRSVVDALGLVRHHQVFADADYLPQAATDGAGAKGRVETEKVIVGLAEGDAVQFKSIAEIDLNILRHQPDIPASAGESVGDRGEEPGAKVLIFRIISGFGDLQAIDQQPGIGRPGTVHLKDVVYLQHAAASVEARVSILLQA